MSWNRVCVVSEISVEGTVTRAEWVKGEVIEELLRQILWSLGGHGNAFGFFFPVRWWVIESIENSHVMLRLCLKRISLAVVLRKDLGTGEYYAKWSKPGSERQIPYDLTYEWNLIKLAKYSQRHWNRQQTDSNQRGGEKEITWGKTGNGHKWTYTRDPWAEPRGDGIEGGRWAWAGWGDVVVGKWRQLYLNIN